MSWIESTSCAQEKSAMTLVSPFKWKSSSEPWFCWVRGTVESDVFRASALLNKLCKPRALLKRYVLLLLIQTFKDLVHVIFDDATALFTKFVGSIFSCPLREANSLKNFYLRLGFINCRMASLDVPWSSERPVIQLWISICLNSWNYVAKGTVLAESYLASKPSKLS